MKMENVSNVEKDLLPINTERDANLALEITLELPIAVTKTEQLENAHRKNVKKANFALLTD
jgi:hypothetical protein